MPPDTLAVKTSVCPTSTVERLAVTEAIPSAGETISVSGLELTLIPFGSRALTMTAYVPTDVGEHGSDNASRPWHPPGSPVQT